MVLRKRTTLGDAGLLKKISVDIHPNLNLIREVNDFHTLFEGQALRTSEHFREAYGEAECSAKPWVKRWTSISTTTAKPMALT